MFFQSIFYCTYITRQNNILINFLNKNTLNDYQLGTVIFTTLRINFFFLIPESFLRVGWGSKNYKFWVPIPLSPPYFLNLTSLSYTKVKKRRRRRRIFTKKKRDVYLLLGLLYKCICYIILTKVHIIFL